VPHQLNIAVEWESASFGTRGKLGSATRKTQTPPNGPTSIGWALSTKLKFLPIRDNDSYILLILFVTDSRYPNEWECRHLRFSMFFRNLYLIQTQDWAILVRFLS
jgi:hypothetical protein